MGLLLIVDLANAFNGFYCCFNALDFSNEIQEQSDKLKDNQHFIIDPQDVKRAFCSVKTKKSHGPDNICGRIVKYCASELSPIFHYIYNKPLQTQHVPATWKDAVVVPVPKSNCPRAVGDFRPVALTSVLMKIFEKLVRTEIVRQTEHISDPMQFAYRPHRGEEDATLTLLNQLFQTFGS